MPTDRPRAWIFDVDGTLALIGDRSPYDMRNVAIDTPNHPVVVAAQAFAAHPDVDALIVVSGRDETARRSTEAWLTFNEIPFDRLLLRRTGDQRADNIVKAEIYDAHIEPHFTVIGVVDDRRSVVEMWRSRGLVCFQVAEGNF
ncbi:polynucleotide kinase [Microbacterium sp. MYb62]|uniref:phosphatase domain-containing protein n=1 Tax=Microbacterium sp. MYb62 TaxID=1848690 RepID=UPI000CFB7989|nr:polynucleotide kinase [Microbacterium sp. MYb62]PRB14763.1 polynucleotide kinase [Microbacterium sp. MYb62]